MTATSNTDLHQLKEFIKDGFNQLDKKIDNKFNELDKKIENKFNELDKKIENKFNELDKKIENVQSELKQEIAEVRSDIKVVDAKQKNVETAVQKIPEITEKFGELKNWRQIAFIIIAGKSPIAYEIMRV
jgi:transcription initiation factor TFIIIB Brf1 subunit/transcription initiation factor TFIIB